MCFATKITTYDHAGRVGIDNMYRYPERPPIAERCPVCYANRVDTHYDEYYECGGGYHSEYVTTSWGEGYHRHDFYFCPFEKVGRKKVAPVFTYAQFLGWNLGLYRQANHHDYYVALEQALVIIRQQDATDGPATGSKVIASGYSDYYEAPVIYKGAQLEVDRDGNISICTQPMIPSTGLTDDGRAYLSTSGGYFVGAKVEDLVRLAGKQPKTFWCWCSSGVGGNHGIYFTIPVPVWAYHNDNKIY